jgi:hypothetical protein
MKKKRKEMQKKGKKLAPTGTPTRDLLPKSRALY